MYLNALSKKEKELFLQASLYISNADGDFSFDEKKMIEQLCQEMNIPTSFEVTVDFEKILEEITEIRSFRNKKIFLFELAGVVMADYVCEDSERKMMYEFAEKADVGRDFIDQAIEKITKLIDFYKEISEFIS